MWRLCAQNVLEPARQADFKAFIAGFKDNYAYRDRAEKPWETWQNRYSAAVDSATSPEVYAAVLESALDELHDFHAEVRSRNPHRWLPVPTFADIWAELHGYDYRVLSVKFSPDIRKCWNRQPTMRIARTHLRVKIMQFVESGLKHCCVCFRRSCRINSRAITVLPCLPWLLSPVPVGVVVLKAGNECLEVRLPCRFRNVLCTEAPHS